MVDVRRANAATFVTLFKDDHRFIIQREHGVSSWFSFTIILNPSPAWTVATVMAAIRDAQVEFRMITGGCFPQHEAIKYFDYDIVGGIENATWRTRTGSSSAITLTICGRNRLASRGARCSPANGCKGV